MITMLLEAVRDLLSANMKGFYFESPSGNERIVPPVYLGGVPSKDKSDESYPCVVVTWAEAEDGRDMDEISIDIFLCAVSKEGLEGRELETAAFADHVRRVLRENEIIANKFERQWPVRAQRPDPKKESHKYAVVLLSTIWRRSHVPQAVEGL